jgi:hypothetical protein
MSPSPHGPFYVELLVPSAETEQEFLLLAVQAALIKYRASQHKDTSPRQPILDEASSMQVVPPHDLGTSSLLVR